MWQFLFLWPSVLSAVPEFLIVKGGFGDEWKDKGIFERFREKFEKQNF